MKKSRRKSQKGMTTDSVLIVIGLVFASFIAGVAYTDYMYKDTPKTQIATVRSMAEIQTQTKLIQCKAKSNELVSRDAEIVVDAYDLVGDKNLPQDRVKDIEDLIRKRQPVINAINAL